ncbi:MAG: outer membrane protein assembly factor BamA [Thermodesulfobacteriota bacterium]|nr:outer membrane protein assembly factor BamA [Thermodesulfobacteriota bacterium]
MHCKWIIKINLFIICFLSIFAGSAAFGHALLLNDKDSWAVSIDAPVISKILVDIHDVTGDKTDWIEMAESLIFLRKGDRFSAIDLQESLDALKLSKKFRKINVDSVEEQEQITIMFHLTPFRLIKDIKISGQYPLFAREILNNMTIYTGDVYVKKKLSEQEALIKNLFQREGFPGPKINLSAGKDSADGFFVVHVKIDKGPYDTLERLEFTGNRAFSDTKLKLKMKIWRASLLIGSPGRFIEEYLKKDIKYLTQYYRRKKYPDVLIDFKTEQNVKGRGVSVFVTIHEGARYDIEFIGNDEFWDFTLEKDMALFDNGNKNDFGLKKSVGNIKDRYRMAGYLETKVDIETKTKTDGDKTIRAIRLVIDEGPGSIVRSIELAGNNAIEDKDLSKQILTRLPGLLEKGVYIPETLEKDMIAIKSLYLKQGYMDAQVKKKVTWSKDKKNVAVRLEIEEGVKTLVSSVDIRGNTVVTEEEACEAIRLKEGAPFRQYMVQSDENALSSLVSEKGYPHVSVKGEVSISRDQSRAEVIYSVDKGPYVTVGRIYYQGNFRTRERILENEIEIKPGDPFSLTQMVQAQQNFRNMEIFDSVQFKSIGLKEKKEKSTLFVEFKEKKPYFVEAGGGFESEKGFFMNAEAGDHNLFGANKDGWLAGEMSQTGYLAEMGVKEPRLLGSRISADIGLFLEQKEDFNQNFGTMAYGSSLGFTRKWSQYLAAGLNFDFEYRDQFIRDSGTAETETLEHNSDQLKPRVLLLTTPSISYDTRDSFVRPAKGVFLSLSAGISKGASNSLDDFLKSRIDFRWYVSPLRVLTFACLGRVGHIEPFNSKNNVPDDQLFFLGGISDVRGFEKNMLCYDTNRDPVGGRTAINGSLEARIDLCRNFELTLFYDVGRVTETYDKAGLDNELRSSVGGGLRYITPIGPIGFLYGIKLDQKEGESPARLYFSFGYTF